MFLPHSIHREYKTNVTPLELERFLLHVIYAYADIYIYIDIFTYILKSIAYIRDCTR